MCGLQKNFDKELQDGEVILHNEEDRNFHE